MMKLFSGECLSVLTEIEADSVNMIMCDLPYGTTACKWDSIIPLDKLWAQYHRVCKQNAAIVLTASQPFTTKLIASNYDEFRYCWVWEKEQGVNFLHVKHQPMKVHEDVCVFYRELPTYNPIMTQGTPYITGEGNSGAVTGSVKKTVTVNAEGLRYPKSVIRINRETGHHPTQKPVELMQYLISTYTNSGDVVLDNTMGSGTTGLACQNLGRGFIGIEADPAIFETAQCRLMRILKPSENQPTFGLHSL